MLFHAAPMQCFTNVHLRRLFRELSANTVLWTEMEKFDSTCLERDALGVRDLQRIQFRPEEGPIVLQIGANDPRTLSQVVQASRGAAEININCGCPSVESGGARNAHYGAALMQRPDLVRELCEACSLADPEMPISVKCRIGVQEQASESALSYDATDTYEELAEFVHAVTHSGAVDHVIVHARAAVLSGLSPSKNRTVPPLRPEFVYQLARDFPKVRVTLNGGIRSIQDAARAAMQATTAAATSAQSSRDQPGYVSDVYPLRTLVPADAGSTATLTSPAGAAAIGPCESLLAGVMCGRLLLRRPLDLWHVDRYDVFSSELRSDARAKPCSSASTAGSHHHHHHHHDHHRRYSRYRQHTQMVRAAMSPLDAVRRYAEYAERMYVGGQSSASELAVPLLLVVEQLRDDLEDDLDADLYADLTLSGDETLAPDKTSSRELVEQGSSILWDAAAALGAKPPVLKSQTDRAALRKLSKALSKRIGVKVAGKILRNRGEV